MGEARRRAAREGLAPADVPIEALRQHALAAHARRDFATARTLAETLVMRDPQSADAHNLLGLSLVEVGNAAAGVRALSRAVELDAVMPAYVVNLALALRLSGDSRAAAERFGEAAKRMPQSGTLHYEHAVLLESLGDDEAAVAAFRRAIAAEPRRTTAHAGLARVLYARGALDEAIAAQRWAVTLDPRAIDDGAIGYASATHGDASHVAHASAVEACRASVAPGDDVEALVAERELRVIDDFEADFEGWRRFALSRPYVDDGSGKDVNFPGVETRGGNATAEQMQRIADALGRDIKWRWPANGAFRLSFASSLARSDIHVDDVLCRPMYAGVLYLSRPEHCRGGTSFWRHRATGWARIPSDDDLRGTPYRTFLDFQRREVLGDGERTGFAELERKRGAWSRVLEVPMKSNRLIVYRSDYFHAISEVFGTTRDDGRLVQLFFLEPR